MSKIIFIVGPTASGKTEVSFLLAKRLKAEIISADSMAIYKEANILTSKPPQHMLNEIPHHLVGSVSVHESYNVYDYFIYAKNLLIDLHKKNIPLIVCGGSGLYVNTLLNGIFEGAGKDEKFRNQLIERAKKNGNAPLYKELETLDPETAKKLSPNDLNRIIRALEVYKLTGTKISTKQKQGNGVYGKFPIKIFGLRLNRDLLYQRINERVDEMFIDGAIDEVKKLISLNLSHTAKKIIGVTEIKSFLQGNISILEAKENIKKITRNFAKRQLTWFNKDSRIEWINIDNVCSTQICDIIVNKKKSNEIYD
ncbi:MAG: tRNA (adenosine(37)-N6)-dimethylallyltransferase MiaA [Candidatus Omnitrophica bacterium]|nr:tRNA (adenosine(37)-N6)-dimethylallyltransferase MiaA [Candidatus Omnitrophota bacterium]